MRNLSEQLNVSVMTPYRYFRDKDEILAAARAWGFDALSDALSTAFEAGGDECVDRARSVAYAYLTFAFENDAVYKLMFDLSQPSETEYPDLARAAARMRVVLVDYVRNLAEAGLVGGEPELAAHVFWAAFHGLVVLKLSDKVSPHLDFEEVWRELTRALTAGFAPAEGVGAGDGEVRLFAA